MLTLLDPTAELDPVARELLQRPNDLTGLTIGLLDISKARGDVFLNEVESHLKKQGLTVKRYMKPTYARIAPIILKQTIATECDLVLEALAD